MRKKRPTVLGYIKKRFMPIYVLCILSTQPSYAFKLREQLKENFNLEVKYSVVYYWLSALERDGYAQSALALSEGHLIKKYKITQEGIDYLTWTINFLES